MKLGARARGEKGEAGGNRKTGLEYGMGKTNVHLEELRKMDRAHHLHPFTDHATMHPSGTHILESGVGCYLQGEEGKLLDGLAGLCPLSVRR